MIQVLICPGQKDRDTECAIPKSRCLPSLGPALYPAWQALEFDWSEASPNSRILCVPSTAKKSTRGLRSPAIHGNAQDPSGAGDVALGNRMRPGVVAKVTPNFPSPQALGKQHPALPRFHSLNLLLPLSLFNSR